MDKIIFYKDINKNQWDGWVAQIGESGSGHCWSFLRYFSKLPDIKENLSFVCLDEKKSAVAICPVGITYNQAGGFNEISFGGNPCAVPALAEKRTRARRKKLEDIFKIIYDLACRHEVKKIKMISQPLTLSLAKNGFKNCGNFEFLRYNFYFSVNNSAVMNLGLSEEVLVGNISKYQRRHIQRGKKKGIEIKVFNNQVSPEGLENYFKQFQKAHFVSAGRLTRPQETWDSMLDGAKNGDASLFVAFFKGSPVSYLYCGEFGQMAFGWSQVNLSEHEKELSPRHILEWEAMLDYKRRGFKYYEIGELFYGPQPFCTPTEKEKSISVLKERYGGDLALKINWIAYLDEQLMAAELNNYWQKFNREAAIFKFPSINGCKEDSSEE